MFGYVRPSDDRLTPADRETFRAAYCGLCHALGARYGLVGRMILNYDLTFLAMVLSDGAGEMCAKRCAVHPMRRRCCVAGDPALDAAADMSVILTYWQLRDGVADHGFWGGLKYRIASVLLRPAYRRARERRPRFDAGTQAHLADLAALTDVFTIGGTKNGALFGEAVVLTVPCPHFRWHIKQRGGMLAKGRLLGVQFQALLKDDLYFDIGRHANDMAFRLRDGFKALGYEFPVPSPSNQQFPVMKIQTAEKLAAMGFEFQVERVIDEEHIMYRFVTSWATPESAIDDLLNALAQCQ